MGRNADAGCAQTTRALRRTNASAAVRRSVTERGRSWTAVAEMARALGISHITSVDPGRVNMGIVRICCATLRPTHWMLVSLNDLCETTQRANPREAFSVDEPMRFGHDDHYHVLFGWVRANAVSNRIFDSELVLVERQEFSREMSSIQAVIQCAILSRKAPLAVYPSDNVTGREPKANRLSSCQQVGADSVKTCYEPLFPRAESETGSKQQQQQRNRKAFGMGNVTRGDNDVTSKQYQENKKNSKLWGSKILPCAAIVERLKAAGTMTEEQETRFFKAKKDDIYDAMWQALYAMETILPCLYNRRNRAFGAAISMYGALPQRHRRTYDALSEFMAANGTDEENVAYIRSVLFQNKINE